jgi:MFS family permease
MLMPRNVMLWRAVVLCIASAMASGFPVTIVVPGMSAMAAALAPGPHGIFLAKQVLTIYGLGMLVGSPVIGWAVQRIGYRPILLAGLVCFICIGSVGYFTTNPWILIGSRFVLGLGTAAILTPSFSLVAYYFEGHARPRLLGFMAGSLAFFGMIISQLAGWVASTAGWQASFLLFGTGFIPLVGAYFVITAKDGSKAAVRAEAVQGDKAPLRDLLGIYGLILWFAVVSINPAAQIPFMLSAQGITDPQLASLIVLVIFSAKLITGPFYGWLSARIGMWFIVALMFLFFAGGHFVAGAMNGLSPALAGTWLIGVGTAMIQPVGAAYIFTRFPLSTHGSAIGGLFACMFVGSFINPVFMAPINAAFGMGGAFVALGLINIGLAGCFAVAAMRRPRQSNERTQHAV